MKRTFRGEFKCQPQTTRELPIPTRFKGLEDRSGGVALYARRTTASGLLVGVMTRERIAVLSKNGWLCQSPAEITKRIEAAQENGQSQHEMRLNWADSLLSSEGVARRRHCRWPMPIP